MAIILLTSMVLLLSAFAFVGSNVSAIEGPALWTDKPDYWPNEVVLVYGSGFEPYSQIDIPVIRPDSTIVIGDGSFNLGWDTVSVNGDGMLAYEYQLDGIIGLYEIRAYATPWSGDTGEIPFTSVTFTDAPPSADIDQLKNGAASDPLSPGDWVNGNLNEQGAHYVEGYSIPYRCVMENMPLGIDIVLTIEYDIKHSDRHAIDYLTYYDRMNDPLHSDVFGHTPEAIDPLQDVTGVSVTMDQYTIPAPTSVGSPVPGQPTQSYNDLVAAEGIEAVQMTLFGGTISNIAYGPQGDLTDSQSAQQIMITFELDSETAVLAWGGHIGSRLDWGFDLVGDPLSAGGISGSPYHMRLIEWYSPDLPENKNLPNLGNQDRSLNAVAVYFAPPGQICVFKYEDMNLNGEYDADDVPLIWHISVYNETMVMVAEGDTNATGWVCFDLPAGTYYVSEASDPDYIGIENGTGTVMVILDASEEEQVIFGNAEKGSICGTKYEDLDGSSTISAGDGILEGWGVDLYMWDGDSYEPLDSTTTAVDGSYCFEGLDPREKYAVYEENRAGWAEIIYEHEDLVFTSSGQQLTDNDFLNFENVTISVCKLEDLTGDGESIDDLPIEGWEVYLYWKATVGGVYAKISTQETDSDGCYEWADLGPGYYKVGEETPDGWTPNNAVEHEFGLVTSGTFTYEFTFLNIEYGSICVFKYEDVNGNGEYDAGDAPIKGWPIHVEHDTYAVPSVDGYTDENGWFCVLNVIPGTYWVVEGSDPDWMAIENGSGNSIMVVITSGDSKEVIFGNAKLISVCGAKYEDVDLNGWSAGDEPIEGWQIDLYGYVDWGAWNSFDYEIHMTTETDEFGEFCFVGLNPFWIYDVYEEDQTGWMHVSDPWDYEGLVSAGSGMNIIGVDFLNVQLGCISGHKYKDVDLSGTINAGDTTVAGWVITLKMWDGNSYEPVTTDTTDYTGKYEFCGLNPYKMYAVYEEMLVIWTEVIFQHEGLIFTSSGQTLNTGTDFLNALNIKICGYKYEDVGLNGWGDDVGVVGWQIDLYGYLNWDDWDSWDWAVHLTMDTGAGGAFCFTNLNPYWIYDVYEEDQTGWMHVSNPWDHEGMVSSGGDITGVNFLNAQLGCISGYKYEDVDLSGTINTGDTIVAGWEVTLKMWDGDSYETAITTLTNVNGKYEFCYLNPYEEWAVYEELRGTWTEVIFEHEGLTFTSSGQTLNTGNDFLNAQNIDICVCKYEDVNLNGCIDDEAPVENWKIDIWAFNPDNIYQWGYAGYGWTGPCGCVCFENLNPYKGYIVSEVVYLDKLEEIGDPWTPAPGWATTAVLYPGTDFQSGDNCDDETAPCVQFLNARNIDLCGYKLEDTDLDGEGDVGVEGWLIEIYGYEPEDWWDMDAWCFYDYVYTDENGHYCFENLNPYLIYDVYEEERSSWTAASPTFIWGLMAEHSGEDITGVNFTNAKNASICGVKWEDHNLNHVIDDSIVWIGWGVDLYKWDGAEYVYVTTTYTGTDPLGGYCFDNLDPYGMYKVIEHTSPYSTPTISEHKGLEFTTSGVNITGMDFLNAENGDICGHKYWDKNADGIFNGEDVPLSGWTVKLYKWSESSWVYVAQDLTNETGVWCFENLNPYLTYKVEEVLQAGWVPINPETGMFAPISFSSSGETLYGYDFMNTLCGPDGKTIGFWSTNIGKYIGTVKGKGTQVAKADICTYLTNIYTKYYLGEGYAYDFLHFPGEMTCKAKLEKAWAILTVPDSAVMQDKAEAQILALLLTEQWKGVDYSNAFTYIPGCITGHGAVMGTMSNIILHILDHYEAGEFMQAKNEADFLNNLPYSMYWCP